MGLFDFGKKKEAPAQGSRTPVDDVVRMRRQGLSNNQIVQALQRNGYPTSQIFDAFSQADLRAPSPVQGIPGIPPPPGTQQRQPFMQGPNESPEQPGLPPDLPGMEGGMENESSITGPQNPEEIQGFGDVGNQGGAGAEFTDYGAPQQPGGYGSYGPDVSAKVEEISEAIIEEKWQDLMKDFNKAMEWKAGMEQRMAVLEQRFSDLKTAFDNLQKSVVDKVSDYDKSVKDVGTEMKALEQVFQKIIPTLTENVNELSRITKGMKPAQKKQ
ncbi:hypothetical protein HYU20_01380 [Candidatus Woesearchaeota archaeon]|nr:hypothetical protein [Candidatus Woesearchaeota archaeon]